MCAPPISNLFQNTKCSFFLGTMYYHSVASGPPCLIADPASWITLPSLARVTKSQQPTSPDQTAVQEPLNPNRDPVYNIVRFSNFRAHSFIDCPIHVFNIHLSIVRIANSSSTFLAHPPSSDNRATPSYILNNPYDPPLAMIARVDAVPRTCMFLLTNVSKHAASAEGAVCRKATRLG